jgi:hypothetical protein
LDVGSRGRDVDREHETKAIVLNFGQRIRRREPDRAPYVVLLAAQRSLYTTTLPLPSARMG